MKQFASVMYGETLLSLDRGAYKCKMFTHQHQTNNSLSVKDAKYCLSTEWNYCKIAFVKVLSTAFNRAYCRLLHAKIDLMGLRLH